jgi:hypothetical protein
MFCSNSVGGGLLVYRDSAEEVAGGEELGRLASTSEAHRSCVESGGEGSSPSACSCDRELGGVKYLSDAGGDRERG